MKPLVANSNSGRLKARDDIHHKTFDGGTSNRRATAKAQRKAARKEAQHQIAKELQIYKKVS